MSAAATSPIQIVVSIEVIVDQTGPTPKVSVSNPAANITRGENVSWICNTTGDLCLAFSNSAYPFALTSVLGNGVPPVLGPFAVSGVQGQMYQYTIGWRQDDTQSWTFTDPVVIVDNPS